MKRKTNKQKIPLLDPVKSSVKKDGEKKKKIKRISLPILPCELEFHRVKKIIDKSECYYLSENNVLDSNIIYISLSQIIPADLF